MLQHSTYINFSPMNALSYLYSTYNYMYKLNLDKTLRP